MGCSVGVHRACSELWWPGRVPFLSGDNGGEIAESATMTWLIRRAGTGMTTRSTSVSSHANLEQFYPGATYMLSIFYTRKG
jgi:hypothetical protein